MSTHPNTHIRALQDLPDVVVAPGNLETCDFLDADTVDAICVGVGAPVAGDDELQPRAGTVHASLRYRIDLAELAARADFTGAAGKVHVIDLPITHGGTGAVLPWQGLPLRIVLVGVGSGTDDDLRAAGAAVAKSVRGMRRVITTVTAGSTTSGTTSFVEGYYLGAYSAWALKAKPAKGPAKELVLLSDSDQDVVDRAKQNASLTWMVRDLTAVPSNLKTPAWLASQFERIAKDNGLAVQRIRGRELKSMGFGGVIAVGQGSQESPEFVVVKYQPKAAQKKSKHVAVIGKGITFDTGGISIKRPRETMITMKTDMAGAATAFAAVLGAHYSQSKNSVTALLPLAENHFGANSTRPSDVVTLFGGETVEIANTDAEGRIVMADALSYAVNELKADAIIDVATLTGAAAMSLGYSHSAVFSNNSELVATVKEAARVTGEPVWEFPLVREYDAALTSDVADIRNVPQTPAGAGAIVAALFLEHFVNATPWMHLDIAGPAHRDRARHELSKGPTGYGARLLAHVVDAL